MRIQSFRLRGIRCFENTRDINLSPSCNIFVGQNNAGKSTLLKAILSWQGFPFVAPDDLRPGHETCDNDLLLTDVSTEDHLRVRPGQSSTLRYIRTYKGAFVARGDSPTADMQGDEPLFRTTWPRNTIIPFIAKRKAVTFSQNVSQSMRGEINGTFSNLYSRIDELSTFGRSTHEAFKKSLMDVIGLPITTKSAANGKEAGFYFTDDDFVTLDRMGDGVSEMAALIVELTLAQNKIFVLEEPETNLHPRGLKALLSLVRDSSSRNQFIIATHSNIVLRELGSDIESSVFRVYRDGDNPSSPSLVAEVERTPAAHLEIIRELGYDFADLELHDAWLFLEESSAETVIRDVLIPWFVPNLQGRLRTFAAGGVDKIESTVSEFQRLITFVHLQPAYKGRLWIRADNDVPGQAMIDSIRTKFPYLTEPHAELFAHPQFELYYPDAFQAETRKVLEIADKKARRAEKARLLASVIAWTRENPEDAKKGWSISASEQIEMLKKISKSLS